MEVYMLSHNQDTWQGTLLPKLFLVRFVQSLSRQRSSWTFMRAGTLVKANTSAAFVARGFPRRVKWRITSSSTGRRGDILVTTVESHLPGTPTLESTWKSTPKEGKCHQSQQEGIVRLFSHLWMKWFGSNPFEDLPSNIKHWLAKANEELFTLWLLYFHSAVPKIQTTQQTKEHNNHNVSERTHVPWRPCSYSISCAPDLILGKFVKPLQIFFFVMVWWENLPNGKSVRF